MDYIKGRGRKKMFALLFKSSNRLHYSDTTTTTYLKRKSFDSILINHYSLQQTGASYHYHHHHHLRSFSAKMTPNPSNVPKKQWAQVFEKAGGPIEYKQIDVPTPGPDEVLINIKYSGVCHTGEA